MVIRHGIPGIFPLGATPRFRPADARATTSHAAKHRLRQAIEMSRRPNLQIPGVRNVQREKREKRLETLRKKYSKVLRTSGKLNALKQVKLLDAMYVVHGYVPDTYMYKYQTVHRFKLRIHKNATHQV